MTSTHILRSLLLTTLLVPSMAIAYTTPEEALSNEDNLQYFTPPPRSRDTEAIQEAQQASAAARRQREQEALFGKSSSSSAASIAAALSSAPAGTTTEPESSLTLEEQRILERVRGQQMDADIEERVRVLISQQGLHSGAPLSDTGPGTILAGFVLAGAGLWTVWKAKRLEAKQ
ncbi:hypothetical protein K8942_00525 [Candidatus Peribacteria bacterium]|nr:MAG: hypothetical protein K8942_00525 [Candidatus Peribacteria bacterium]